jgi:hypothetical protein
MKKKQAKQMGKFFRDACLKFTDEEFIEVMLYIANIFDKKIDNDFKELNEGLNNIKKLTEKYKLEG